MWEHHANVSVLPYGILITEKSEDLSMFFLFSLLSSHHLQLT